MLKKFTNFINEDATSIPDHSIPADHPINNPIWTEMLSEVEGDLVTTLKYVPNQMLVIEGIRHKYTITRSKLPQ